HIGISVQTPAESDRITFPVSTETRVVVPEVVVVKICLLVGVLAWEPQRELERSKANGIFARRAASKGLGVVVAPDWGSTRISDQSRCVEMVDMDEVKLHRGR